MVSGKGQMSAKCVVAVNMGGGVNACREIAGATDVVNVSVL